MPSFEWSVVQGASLFGVDLHVLVKQDRQYHVWNMVTIGVVYSTVDLDKIHSLINKDDTN